MQQIFRFGESHPDFPVRVINEREARAGAGILLFFGLIAFSNAFLKGEFLLTRTAIVAFGIDFVIRVLINPQFSPSLVLGRLMVRKQKPEYVGAPQKRFAWGLGLAIAVFMGVWVLGLNLAGPVAIVGCLTCIILLFFETAFGICIGCKIYGLFWPEKVKLCPGGTCDVVEREPITKTSLAQLGVVASILVMIGFAVPNLAGLPSPNMSLSQSRDGKEKDCTVPRFAKLIGHEEQWKLHNGCK